MAFGVVLNLYKPFSQLLDYSLFEENLVNFFFMGKKQFVETLK